MNAFSAYLESPKNVSFESQEKGESIIFLLRRHWVTNFKWVLFGILLIIFPAVYEFVFLQEFPFSFLPKKYHVVVGIIWYLFSFIFILENYLIWYFNVYIITDRRVIDTDFYGIIHKKVSETPLRNIQDSTYNVSGIMATIFNFGDIKIQTAAESPEFEFEMVPNPSYIHDKLNDLISYNQKKIWKNKKIGFLHDT
jgi:uncharacterized membrane protein YdbT with pleckstrin-like domain